MRVVPVAFDFVADAVGRDLLGGTVACQVAAREAAVDLLESFAGDVAGPVDGEGYAKDGGDVGAAESSGSGVPSWLGSRTMGQGGCKV
jgi:hypothetical protein